MKSISDKEIVLTCLAAVGTAIIMTPLFGIWIWIALMLSGWIAWLCLDACESAMQCGR